jgi:spermidine synthase
MAGVSAFIRESTFQEPDSQTDLYNKARKLFFISGASSLVVETVLAKILGYILGITAHATAVVLAAFMAGLAIGSWLLGRYSEKIRQPLRLYGALEFLVGWYALAVPLAYPVFSRAVPVLLAGRDYSPLVQYLYRYGIASIVVLLPAVVMGGTLPLLVRALIRNDHGLQTRLGDLYGINTLGATTGALAATYFTNYLIGLQGSLALVFAMNLYIFASTRKMQQSPRNERSFSEPPATRSVIWPRRALLGLAFFTGTVTFVLENIWTHTLAAVVGMSVYAFGAMLGTLLLGIATGAMLLDRVRARTQWETVPLLGTALFLEGLLVAITLPLWDRIPLVLPFLSYLDPGFALGEAARFFFCAILILGPAICMGASFPLLLELYSRSAAGVGRKVGTVYGWNTVGAILGSLATGFILIGRVSSQHIIEACAASIVAAAWLVTAGDAETGAVYRLWRHLAPAAVLLLLVLTPSWNLDRLALGGWITYTDPRDVIQRGTLIDSAEDPSGGIITVHRNRNGGISFFTNGKFDASYPTAVFAKNHSFQPALFTRHSDRALTIGIGGGGNIGVLYRLGFQHIDGVDLSAKMVDFAKQYNRRGAEGAFDSDRLAIHIADGRNYLMGTSAQYDIVVIELSAVWVANAGNLFNKEFFELVRSHLKSDGVMSTYLQLKQVNYEDLLIILNTIRQVFPHVAYFTTAEQGHLIASKQPLEVQFDRVDHWNHDPAVRNLLSHAPDNDMFALLGNKLLFFPDEFRNVFDVFDRFPLLKNLFVSTDMYPRAEYGTPRGMLNRLAYEANYAKLAEAGDPSRIPPVRGIPSKADALAIAGAYYTEHAINSQSRDFAAAIRCYQQALAIRENPEWRRRLGRLIERSDPAHSAASLGWPTDGSNDQ